MSARLSSLTGSVSILNGTLVSPCTLLFALEAYEHLRPTLDLLDIVKGAHRQRHRSGTTGALGRLPDEVWEAIKGELRAMEYVRLEEQALEPLRGCKWCREEEDRPAEEASWQTWLEWAMRPTPDWDIQQESGSACQVCGECAEQLQQDAVTASYEPLLDHYDLHVRRPHSLDPPNDASYLALLHSPSVPHVPFDLLPNSRQPRPSSSLIQLDAAQIPAAPTERQLASYGRFFREWPGVEIVRDPQHAARGLTGPAWLPRLTVWHEAEPELD
ncbi:hypothetical protein JCM6882_001872 [Rhodosporidiobolus microsporus]